MGNRFRNRNYGRGRGRGDHGRRRYSPGGFGGYDYDREENYFGGGGSLGYGTGYTGSGYERGYGRGFEDDYERYERPNRRRTGRENYYGEAYRDENDHERGDYGYYGLSGYDDERGYGGGGFRNRRSYERRGGGSYTDDERGYGRSGYDHEPENDYDAEERGFFEKAGDEIASWFGDEEAERRRQMDAIRKGFRRNHRGRGPRGYTRPDERIKEDINDRLTDDYYLDASDINVEVSGGEIILTGTVETRFDKRRAEDIAEEVSGVKHLENRIRVRHSFFERTDSSSAPTGTTGDSPFGATGSTAAETTGGSNASETPTSKSRGKTA